MFLALPESNARFQPLTVLAEGTGFEPAKPCGSPVFETGTFDHSDTLPKHSIITQVLDKLQILSRQLRDRRHYSCRNVRCWRRKVATIPGGQ